jgi:amino acid transporter
MDNKNMKAKKSKSISTKSHFGALKIFIVDILIMSITMIFLLFFISSLFILINSYVIIIWLIISSIICLSFGIFFYKECEKIKKIDRHGWILTLAAFVITVLLLVVLFIFLFPFFIIIT